MTQRSSTFEREQRLAEIRRQIDAGTYETPERLTGAVDALWESLALDATTQPEREEQLRATEPTPKRPK